MIDTHDVVNQATPLRDYNPFETDLALTRALSREGAGWAESRMSRFGAAVGSGETQDLAYLANRYPPELRTHDAFGHRVDEVDYHPAYHQLMQIAFGGGVHSLAQNATESGGHVARSVLSYLFNQVENGVGCPTGMAYAALALLAAHPQMGEWAAKLAVEDYEPGLVPIAQKQAITLGMTLTEKQAGSDLRATMTTARPITLGGDEYLLTGHKWFCSAPMSDGFLVMATAEEGPTLFLVPRVHDDGSRNRVFIQMLKDKCGNRSNASSSIELHDTYAIRLGEEGTGIRSAMEDAHFTRLDFAVGSAGMMRQALIQAVHYTRGRQAFHKPLGEQPLMLNVLSDLAIESEAMMVLTLRIARSLDEAGGDAAEAQLRRIGPPLVKYFVCKMVPTFTAETMECMGGNGYIENHPMARLYREAPLNTIWEGTSNMVCLDVLRALQRDPNLLDALMDEFQTGRGGSRILDAAIDELPDQLVGLDDHPFHARWISERMVRIWQASILVQHGSEAVADAFISSRLDGGRGTHFGSLRGNIPSERIVEDAFPQ